MKSLLMLLAGVLAFSPSLRAQTPIGFVDVERCLKEYKKAEEQRKQLKAELDDGIRAIQEEKRKVEALKDQMDLYTAGSDEWLALAKKIKLSAAQIELNQQELQFKVQARLAELIAKLYADVKREVKNVAEAKKLKLILMYVASEPKGSNDTEVTNNIMVRPVMYFDPSSDITAEVIDRLNK
jgi:Skp family chaperone for outer membrane proteins